MQLKKLDLLGKPYRIYAEVLESGAIDQFVNCMSLPDVVQGALMPDAHTGYVMPIGAVVATRGTIYPSFVGYDIGCGMSATKLDISLGDVDGLEEVAHALEGVEHEQHLAGTSEIVHAVGHYLV